MTEKRSLAGEALVALSVKETDLQRLIDCVQSVIDDSRDMRTEIRMNQATRLRLEAGIRRASLPWPVVTSEPAGVSVTRTGNDLCAAETRVSTISAWNRRADDARIEAAEQYAIILIGEKKQAADRIEALEAALEPFAKMAGHPVMFVSTASSRVQVDTDDFRRAADLLARKVTAGEVER